MKAILGAFRTTATTALEIESGLMPSYLRLQSKILRSYTRLASLPKDHPPNTCLTRAASSRSQIYISPLEHLPQSFPEYFPSTMETVYLYVRPLWWIPSHHIEISDNKKEAKKRHDATAQEPASTQRVLE